MDFSEQIRLSKFWTLVFFAMLLVSLLTAQLLPGVDFNWPVLLFQAVPLMLFLPGLIKGKGIVYVWLGCLLLLYSSKLISDVVVSGGSWISLLQTLSCIGLFTSALYFVHWKGKLRKLNAE